MDRSLDWTLLRTFRAVLAEGGLSQAARVLGLSQPSVGRHIDALEEVLGGALFTRSRTGMQPTALALKLAPHAEAMASAVATLSRTASSSDEAISGPIRLTASEIMAQEVLPPMLASFIEDYPLIELELVVSNDTVNLLTREADMAVRMVRPEQQAIVARKVGTTGIGLFAHRRYLDRHGMPETLDDMLTHRLIGYDRNPMIVRQMAGIDIDIRPEMFTFRSDSEPTQLAMLRAGYGIGGIQLPLAGKEPDLVQVLPDLLRFELEVWLAMHERLRLSRAMRLLMDHLAGHLDRFCRFRA